jgi:hypothetical protein
LYIKYLKSRYVLPRLKLTVAKMLVGVSIIASNKVTIAIFTLKNS